MTDKPLDAIFSTYNNPLAFVKCAYPWREHKSPLEHRIIEKWQEQTLKLIGEQIVKKESKDKNNYVIRVAIKSGQGIGKTTTLSWLIHWFMSTRINPHVIVTANTESQLKTVDWRELSKWHQMAFNKEWFEWTATSFYLKEKPESHRALAIPYNEGRPESFQGIHADDVLIIFDEASGIPEIIWEVIEGTIKTGRCIFLAFSNPTQNSGSFRQCFGNNAHRWKGITVDSREVSFTNKEEVEEDIRTNGEDSDYVRVRIKGEFPRVGNRQFISGELIEQCFNHEELFYKDFNVIIGVDPARGGNDESVLCIRQGRKVHAFLGYRGIKDGKELASLVVEQCKIWNTSTIFVDGVGIGASVYDFLNMFGYQPIDVQSAGNPDDKAKFQNRRDEMYGRLKETMEKGLDIERNNDNIKLKDQLECITYHFTSLLQLKLDKKDDLVKKGFSSPDRADALALTFAYKTNETQIMEKVTVVRTNNLLNTKRRK